MRTVRAVAIFAVVSLLLIAVLGWAIGLVFDGPGAGRAIRISAVTAFVLQLFAFTIARVVSRTNLMAGWGLGALLRLATLALFGFVMLKPFGLPAAPAMISLAVFLFASTLVEPLLLGK